MKCKECGGRVFTQPFEVLMKVSSDERDNLKYDVEEIIEELGELWCYNCGKGTEIVMEK